MNQLTIVFADKEKRKGRESWSYLERKTRNIFVELWKMDQEGHVEI
jgi:hypothetical protein